MIRELLLLVLAAALINNLVLGQFLGFSFFAGESAKIKSAACMGALLTALVTLTSALTAVIYNLVLLPYNLLYLNTFVFVVLIAALVRTLALVLEKWADKYYQVLKDKLWLMMANCAVLGVALINVQQGFNILNSIINAFFLGLGFLAAIVLLATIRERIVHNHIPASFKGMPIILLVSGLMAMAILGLSNLLKL